jgi:cytochrome c oxidase cbb3-type subunit 3
MTRSFSLAVVSMLALLWTLACGEEPPAFDRASAPVPVTVAVGPIPGPPHDTPMMANPFSGDRTATGEGRQLFIRFNCSGCHGGRAGGGMGPSLRDVDWLYGSTEAQVFSSIAEGRAHGMPSWRPRMSPDQMWKLVAYIKSLRTRNEPQPPTTE